MPRGAEAALAEGAGRGWRPSMPKVGSLRRGVGIGCMWYGIGNTSMSNPSHMKIGLSPAGTLTLYSGALDVGQGSNTIIDPDRGPMRSACPPRSSTWCRATPISPPMPARLRPRARPSCRQGGRARRPATCASRSCGWPMPAPTPRSPSTGAKLELRRLRGADPRSRDRTADLMGEGRLRSADHAARSGRPGSCLMRPMPSPPSKIATVEVDFSEPRHG